MPGCPVYVGVFVYWLSMCHGQGHHKVKVITRSRTQKHCHYKDFWQLPDFCSKYKGIVLLKHFHKTCTNIIDLIKSKSLNYLQHTYSFVRFFIRHALKVVYTFLTWSAIGSAIKTQKVIAEFNIHHTCYSKIGKCFTKVLWPDSPLDVYIQELWRVAETIQICSMLSKAVFLYRVYGT